MDFDIFLVRYEEDKVFGMLFIFNLFYGGFIKYILRVDKFFDLDDVCV